MIAIFGNPKDPHATEIQERILAWGYECAIVSTAREDLKKTEYSFSYSSGGACSSSLELTQDGRLINIDDIGAALVLQPIFSLFSGTDTVFSQDLKFWYFTWRESLFGAYLMLDRRQRLVNRSVHQAISNQNKIGYIAKSQTTHLKKPATLITNNPVEINSFLAGKDGAIVKTLHQMQLQLDGEQVMLLASMVKVDNFSTFSQDGECPVLLQEYINKVYDLRLTVVGDTVFSCKIDATKSKVGRVDWRAYDLANTPHTQHNLPSELEREIICICRSMDLDYATIDLCVDRFGAHWLLDINPFGKYLWIEDAVGYPITDAIARLLIEKASGDQKGTHGGGRVRSLI